MTRPLVTAACHCGLVLLGRAECTACSRAVLVFDLPTRPSRAPVLAFAALCALALALLWVAS